MLFQAAIRFACIAMLLMASGCSREHYRVRADNDAYGRLIEKTVATPWMPPASYSVYPKPHSRLYDPTPIESPCLPIPSPQLYDYDLPPLPERDNSRFRPQHDGESPADLDPEDARPGNPSQPMPEPAADEREPGDRSEQPPIAPAPPSVKPVSYSPDDKFQQYLGDAATTQNQFAKPKLDGERLAQTDLNLDGPLDSAVPNETQNSSNENSSPTGVAQELVARELNDAEVNPNGSNDSDSTDTDSADADSSNDDFDDSPQAKQVPIPKSYWNSIPSDCLARMLEFQSVRDEYAATFGKQPDERLLDDSPKLALEDIVQLTLLNSRELQTQKENLYRAALALTLERFAYQLRPSVGGNGTDVNYSHNRNGGITTDTLRIPTTAQIEKMLYTGGDILGRFANNVVLTFNGPQGFAADVSSELFFSISQSVLQRDVLLESLTQSERNVIYAARDFVRFRRELFVQQASDYYSLILQYRQVEINCQNYFTLAREFNQRSVETKFGLAAPTQLDQVEQQVIGGRQSILSTCTSLENALDSLKIRMGLPTEQMINLDLSELNLLTLRDELAANGQRIARTRTRLSQEIGSESRSPLVIIAGLGQLVEQMLNTLDLREKLGENPPDTTDLENILLELRIEAADIDVEEDRVDLQQELAEPAPDATKVIQRSRDVAVELIKKVDWQVRLLSRTSDSKLENDARVESFREFEKRLDQLDSRFLKVINDEQINDVDTDAEKVLVEEARTLLRDLENVAAEYDQLLDRPPMSREVFENRALAFANLILDESQSFLNSAGAGLVPIRVDMDDAMMAGLVQRFDLMNERGFLADDWRQIKYAADELRSVLNLQATHSLRTRDGENNPFEITLQDSTTTAALSFDLPFNRRAQRNSFRNSIFNYQAALRRVMQLEDNIKLSVRRDVRSLKLNRQQYENDVAGAALASQRVTGTQLEVRGGFATSRDFLESQTAYVQAISNVASRHINYIVGRLQLFLDLEALTVGDDGFWDKLYDESYQPEMAGQLPNYEPAYGRLHPKLRYSKKIRCMECVPRGSAMIHHIEDRPPATPEQVAD